MKMSEVNEGNWAASQMATATRTLTQQSVLEDTCRHFTALNRGVRAQYGGCSYGAGCAIGRLVPEELAVALDSMESADGTGIQDSDLVWEALPADVQLLGRKFLVDLQRLHDIAKNWCNSGLSQVGVRMARRMTGKYILKAGFLDAIEGKAGAP